ncbi:LON peptidase substrate-binding domain-containing protein [Thioalkalivibrio sp. HK1]|uniref:LON peptidase substrate-binding domain-containing protein n=1 Tax=Thioalkalivibrio sp. HK1 TaxID=1469245 RepID=UPI00046FFCAC|nr:LON peptidase substrate-binding domain-containing protein [Thioalkalivibrio sp. HK1]
MPGTLKTLGASSSDSPSIDSQASDRNRVLDEVPIFALDTVLYPEGSLPLRIFEPRYVNMVGERLQKDAPFIVALTRTNEAIDRSEGEAIDESDGDKGNRLGIDDGEEKTGRSITHRIGTLARIVDWGQLEDGLLGITALGGRRVRIGDFTIRADDLRVAISARMLPEEPACIVPDEYRPMADLLRHIHTHLHPSGHSTAPRFDDASWLGYRMSELLPIPLVRKQHFLEIEDPLKRLNEIRRIIEMLLEGGRPVGPVH